MNTEEVSQILVGGGNIRTEVKEACDEEAVQGIGIENSVEMKKDRENHWDANTVIHSTPALYGMLLQYQQV